MFDMFINDLGVTMFRVVPYLVDSNWETTNDNDDPNVMNWEYYNNRYSSPIFEATWKAIRYLNSRGIQPEIGLMGPVPTWMLAEKAGPRPPGHTACDPSSDIAPMKPSMYPEFAEEVVSMLMYARSKEKLKFQYFSPFNETDCYPWEGPRIDPADAPSVLAAVASRLQKEGLGDIRLEVPDNALISNDYVTPILKNSELMKQVGAFAFHSYSDSSVGPQVERIKASAYPDTPVWLTEYGDLSDRDKTAENEWKSFSLATNRRALIALNQGANALFYFNAFDDYEECMRRLTFYGLFHSGDQVYFPRKRYYATKQLYHFVEPGARRVASTSVDARSNRFRIPEPRIQFAGDRWRQGRRSQPHPGCLPGSGSCSGSFGLLSHQPVGELPQAGLHTSTEWSGGSGPARRGRIHASGFGWIKHQMNGPGRTSGRSEAGDRNTMRLQDKVAVITGAGSGIGRACALEFARQGASVVVADIDFASAQRTVAEIGPSAIAILTDVSSPSSVRDLVVHTLAAFSSVHALVNNAAIQVSKTIEDTTPEEWNRQMAVNVGGVFLCSKAFLPHLKASHGAIVNMASVNGYFVEPFCAGYCATKAAIIGLTKAMAIDLGPDQIRVNCICPGYIDAGLAEGYFQAQSDPAAARKAAGALHALGRIGRPEEVARVAAFLASEDASFMTGSTYSCRWWLWFRAAPHRCPHPLLRDA